MSRKNVVDNKRSNPLQVIRNNINSLLITETGVIVQTRYRVVCFPMQWENSRLRSMMGFNTPSPSRRITIISDYRPRLFLVELSWVGPGVYYACGLCESVKVSFLWWCVFDLTAMGICHAREAYSKINADNKVYNDFERERTWHGCSTRCLFVICTGGYDRQGWMRISHWGGVWLVWNG